MYIYESHMGGYYTSDEYHNHDSLYCDTCGDSDYCLGYANNKEEALSLLDVDTFTEEYINEFVNSLVFE